MEAQLYLISGIVILLAGMADFFFTTLSGSGAGFISKPVASFSNFLVKKSSSVFGRKVFDYSGLVVNMAVLAVWILLIWIGLFLVFTYDAGAVVNSDSRVANWVERLYFTGYILSTLGLGNFKPTSPFFEIMTSLFSFFGFIFFTSAMTYLISVSSAVTVKRTLARSINNLGKHPQQIAEALQTLDKRYYYNQLLNLQELIDKHIVNHQAYPVVHFFSNSTKQACFSLNLARLDEAVSLLLVLEKENTKELKLLRESITNLLEHIEQNYKRHLSTTPQVNNYSSMPAELQAVELQNRRAIIGGMLKSEGLSWKDV